MRFSTFYDPRLYPRLYPRHTTFNPRHTTYSDTQLKRLKNRTSILYARANLATGRSDYKIWSGINVALACE